MRAIQVGMLHISFYVVMIFLDFVTTFAPILSVDYNSIIPILTKGIQEQQLLIEAQQKQIDEMKLMLEKLINDKK